MPPHTPAYTLPFLVVLVVIMLTGATLCPMHVFRTLNDPTVDVTPFDLLHLQNKSWVRQLRYCFGPFLTHL